MLNPDLPEGETPQMPTSEYTEGTCVKQEAAPLPIIISPVPGCVVWYHHPNVPPLAAVVAYVHSDRLVNLMVIDSTGWPQSKLSVRLIQEGDIVREGEGYCEWMPYQFYGKLLRNTHN